MVLVFGIEIPLVELLLLYALLGAIGLMVIIFLIQRSRSVLKESAQSVAKAPQAGALGTTQFLVTKSAVHDGTRIKTSLLLINKNSETTQVKLEDSLPTDAVIEKLNGVKHVDNKIVANWDSMKTDQVERVEYWMQTSSTTLPEAVVHYFTDAPHVQTTQPVTIQAHEPPQTSLPDTETPSKKILDSQLLELTRERDALFDEASSTLKQLAKEKVEEEKLHKKIDNLTQQIDRMKALSRLTTKQKETLTSRKKDLSVARKALTQKSQLVTERSTEADQLTTKQKMLSEDLRKLSDRRLELEYVVGQLEDQISKDIEDHKIIQDEVLNLDEKRTQLESNLTKLGSNLDIVSKKIDSGEITLGSMVDEIKRMRAAKESAVRRLSDLNLQRTAMETDLDHLRTLSHAAKTKSKQKLREYLDHIKALQESKEPLENQITDLTLTVNAMNSKLDDLTVQVSSQSTELDSKRHEKEKISKDIDNMVLQKTYLHTEIDELKETIDDLTGNLDNLTSEISTKRTLTTDMKLLQDEKTKLETQVSEISTQQKDLKQEFDTLVAHTQMKKTERAALSKNITTMQNKKQILEKDVIDLKDQYSDLVDKVSQSK